MSFSRNFYSFVNSFRYRIHGGFHLEPETYYYYTGSYPNDYHCLHGDHVLQLSSRTTHTGHLKGEAKRHLNFKEIFYFQLNFFTFGDPNSLTY